MLSLGRMGIRPSGDLLNLMTQHAILTADKYTPRAISSVLWAHVTLKLPEDPRMWDALLDSARSWIMSDQVRVQHRPANEIHACLNRSWRAQNARRWTG